jgi:hypothetical protein
MENLFSIKETKELVKFIGTLVNNADKAMEDGKIGIMDSALLFEPLRLASSAFSDIGKVPQEIMDLTTEEATELKLFVKELLDLRDEHMEEISEDTFVLAVDFVIVLRKLRAVKETTIEPVEGTEETPLFPEDPSDISDPA